MTYLLFIKKELVGTNKTYFKKSKSKYRIDFTPTYLFEEKAPKRILKHLGGKIKFIVILRNPVDRAYSHYLHSCRNLHEKLTFKKALISEKREHVVMILIISKS